MISRQYPHGLTGTLVPQGSGWVIARQTRPTPVSPSTVPGATPTAVTVTGVGFTAPHTTQAGTSCTIGGVACTGLAVVNDTTITCTTGVMSAGAQASVVANENGTDTVPRAVTVT